MASNLALVLIENDGNEKLITKNTIRSIRSNLKRLETAFMLNVWSVLLSRIKDIIVKLQRVDTSLPDILDLCQSLINLVESIRKNFDIYKERALDVSVVKEYEKHTR